LKNKHGGRNVVVRIAFVVIVLFLIGSVVNMQYELRDMKERKDVLLEQIKDTEDEILEIQMRLDEPLTDDYIKRVLREKYDYRFPGEIIFKNPIAD